MTVRVQVKKYVMDETLSWEERYKKLEEHHNEESKWLIERCEKLIEAGKTCVEDLMSPFPAETQAIVKLKTGDTSVEKMIVAIKTAEGR